MFADVTNEQYLAGCILLEGTVIWGLDGIVTAESFEDDGCRAIYEAALELKAEGVPVDLLSILERTRRNGADLPQKYLADLMSIVPTTVNFAEYAKRIAESARKRKLQELAAEIQNDNLSTVNELIEKVEHEASRLREDPANSDYLSLFKSLDSFSEEDASWLIPGWVPEAQITLVAADGGVGKTTLWCHIIAALSAGRTCLLDPPGHTRTPQKIAFCTTEDSVKKKLLKKLRECGANLKNIITVDFAADKSGLLRNFKFGSKELDQFVRHFKPALCVFDPVQGFLPPLVNMSARNQMRDCMAPLITLGEETGTTFMIICHTNKRKGAFGRDRIADSADLWDISRSVIMAGYTENQGIRYLSNEKNNYSQLQETHLFSIDAAGQILSEGTSWKRDKDYMIEASAAKAPTKRGDCKECIISVLTEAPEQCIKSDNLVKKLQDQGYAFETIKRARKDLCSSGVIENYYVGVSQKRGRQCFVRLKQPDFEPLPMDWVTPFSGETQENDLLLEIS